MRIVKVSIRGEVQQVGFRNWAEREALMRGLEGWVRNRVDGSVECVFAGEPEAVEAVLERCASGPERARVARVDVEAAEPADLGLRTDGVIFDVLPTI